MDSIKLGDLYLPKEESKDIIELLAKKRNIKNYKSKSNDKFYNIFKKQLKIRKEKNLTFCSYQKSIIRTIENSHKSIIYV